MDARTSFQNPRLSNFYFISSSLNYSLAEAAEIVSGTVGKISYKEYD